MKYIRTTATAVRKLKQQAKTLSKARTIQLNQALDIVAKEAGYDDFHHVTEMLARWQKEEAQAPAESHFADMPHPGRIIFEWLEANYRDAINEVQDRTWRFLQPDEPIDWSRQDQGSMNLISSNLAEYVVAECSLTVGSRTVRIGQLVLNESGDLLSPTQRQFVQELMATTIRPYLVSSAVQGESITLVDLLNDDDLPIRVPATDLSKKTVKGTCFGMRVLQANTRPYLTRGVGRFTRPALARW